MATRPTGQGPGRRPRRRHHHTSHHDREEDNQTATEAGSEAGSACRPGSLAGHPTEPGIEDATARLAPTAPAGTDPASASSHAARARRVHDSQIDAALDAIVDQAPPLTYEDRARIAFLLGRHCGGPPRQRGPTAET